MGYMSDKYSPNKKKFDYTFEGDYEYVKPADLNTNLKYVIALLYINKNTRYGDQPCAVLRENNVILNIPKHMLDEVKDIINDATAVDLINNGKVAVQSYTYQLEDGIHYGINFVDI